jgi:hypothetical protein
MGIQDLTDTGVTVGSEMYAYNDEVASCVDTLTAENNEFCISGTAGQVVNMMWDTIWGGGVGIKLAGGDPMDLTAYEGFSFTLSGTAIPSELRVGVLMDGDDNDYFTTDVAMGANALAFADLMNGDWIDEPGTLVTSMITEMKWQVPSNASAEQMFEFCVSDLALETEVAGMGGAGGATP